jgi:hypothetical protein
MGDEGLERTVQYTFDMVDNITPVTTQAKDSIDGLNKKMGETNEEIIKTNTNYIKSMQALSGFRQGITATVSGMEELGIVNRENNKGLYQLVGGIQLFVGIAQALKGVVGIVTMLRNATASLAGVEAFRAVLKNPATIGVVMAGVGIAGAAVGYMTGAADASGKQNNMSSGPNVTQNISFSGGGAPGYESRTVARDALESMGG